MIRQYDENEFVIKEYENGSVVKQAKAVEVPTIEEVERISLEQRLEEIETTLDILVLKSEGVIA